MNFKKTIILLLILLVTFSTFAQVNEKRITISFANIPLSEAITRIERASSYTFFYDASKIDLKQNVSLSANNMPISQAMASMLANTKTTHEITNTQIALFQRTSSISDIQPKENNTRSITGAVLDNITKEPIIGAVVKVDGTNIATITDVDGNFSLNVPPSGNLSITSIGFESQEIRLSEQSNYNVELAESSSTLDEVVVIGYGTQRRSLVANAIAKVAIEDKDLRQVASPSQLLEGKVAGLTVITGSGNLGAGERMSIRGASSLSASNEPLYVIDGIPNVAGNANVFNFGESMSSLAALNLNDIESIEVLKDAASAAIYGSRATNGVVVITTKSGKKGASNVRLNVTTGFSQFANPHKLKFANSDLFLMQYNEGIDNYNRQNGYNVGDAGYLVHWANPFQGLPDSDWLSYITQTGSLFNSDLSFSGGFNKTTYYISGAVSKQTGIVKTNSLDKINLKTKINHEVRPWLEIGANVSGNYMKNSQVPGANLGSTILARAVEQRPFDRPYKPNGDYYLGGTDLLVRHNPVQILNEQNAYFDNYRYLGTYYALMKWNKFSLKSSLNNDISYTYDFTHYKEKHPYSTGTGRIVEYNRLLNNFLVENVLTYNDKIKKFDLNTMFGHSFQKISSRTTMIDGRGFPSPAFDVISSAAEIYDASGTEVTGQVFDYTTMLAPLANNGGSTYTCLLQGANNPAITLGMNAAQLTTLGASLTPSVPASVMQFDQIGNSREGKNMMGSCVKQ